MRLELNNSINTTMSKNGLFTKSWVEKSKFVPLRLNEDERRILGLLEAALNVIEYTDRVDIISYTSRTKLMVTYLSEMCSILTGLIVAMDVKLGRSLLQGKDHATNADFFKYIFEIGRRYKIMNPEKMRTTYGAMMYMCQDSMIPDVRMQMGFDFYIPIKTVFRVLEENSLLDVLSEKQLLDSSLQQIDPYAGASLRSKINEERKKSSDVLLKKYAKGNDEKKRVLEDCLVSLADHESFLMANRVPVEKMRFYLHEFFSSQDSKKGGNLKIGFMNGARLTHDHRTQFFYVDQSLQFWSCMMDQMFLLWLQSDASLVDKDTRYFISDTGQGLNRVQPCPVLRGTVHKILSGVQNEQELSWIGSSVVHLGDRAVPNALMFIDKYRQVPHILTPLVKVLQQLEYLRDPFLVQYIEEEYGSIGGLQKTLLLDFFKHAFDGRGADNWYDAGSCIDGRLTSAWNWTNEISKKKYYRILLMSGFLNFEGI